MITKNAVIQSLGSLLLQTKGSDNVRFRNVVIDSRLVKRGDLFVALPGERTDGHNYVTDAVGRGAAGVLVARNVEDVPAVTFVVDDTLRALQRLASAKRERMTVQVIGITGSVGKTTTKELTAAVLASKYEVLKSEANYNNEIGLPLTLLKLTRKHQRAVLEMGMYALGEIRTLCEIARPEIGVVTNVGPVHLERLGSMEAIAAAKSELPESLPAHGFAILNADDPIVCAMAERTKAKTFFYGVTPDAGVRASDVAGRGLAGVTFKMHYGGDDVVVESRLPARQLVSNALAAATVGLVSGLGLAEVADALSTADVRVRLRTFKTASGATVIDDTYNASPASMNAALELLGEIPGHRIAVLGDMGELGSASDEGHRAVGRRAAEVADVIHAVGQHARLIAEAARAAGHRDVHHWAAKDGVIAALGALSDHDIVLLKASRAMAFESLVAALADQDG